MARPQLTDIQFTAMFRKRKFSILKIRKVNVERYSSYVD
jgi:hypothetical protein